MAARRCRATATGPAPRASDLPDVLSPEQAASLLRVSVNTLYAEVRAGRIPHLRLGRGIRISKAALLGALAGGPSAQEEGVSRLRLVRGSAHREG